MDHTLVIVESPTKAKTIRKFLPSNYEVLASMGHVRDLPKGAAEIPAAVKKEKWSRIGVNTTEDFEPLYIVPKDKKKVVKELKDALKGATQLLLATDEDREGESISWHLMQILKPKIPTKRMVFHEITKKAINKALDQTREIDMELVQAQETRRILDRLFGYELSPLLWKKVAPRLSAGRVQSVSVRLLVRRERERRSFKKASYWGIKASLVKDNITFETKLFSLNGQRISNGSDFDEQTGKLKEGNKSLTIGKEQVNDLLKTFSSEDWLVSKIEKKPSTRKPVPPFTTSTLQQEANRKLRLSARETMRCAQGLYERGFITYMRTDSVHLSEQATRAARECVSSMYGKEYLSYSPRQFNSTARNTQEAHEAIRPAGEVFKTPKETNLTGRDLSLYDLIWKRTVASQMSDAILDKTIVKINSNNHDGIFQSEGEVIKFDGFLKLYQETKDNIVLDESKNNILPDFYEGEEVNKIKISVTQSFSKAPFRFSEATLVKKMEELGIGRPSTYAPTISTVMNRKYVFKGTNDAKTRQIVQYNISDEIIKETKTENFGSNKGKLVPSEVGILVNEFLTNNFKNIVDYNFTANVENEFDLIANGAKDWKSIINKFYEPFSLVIEDVQKNAKRETGERILGSDPKSGRQLSVKLGKYGPIAQIGKVDDEEKPLFASLLPEQQISTISFEDAIKLFDLPVYVGDHENEKVEANIGRYGPYIRYNKIFIPIPEGFNPFTITLDKSIELIEAKKAAQKPLITYKSHDVTKGRGRFGPYLKWNNTFINVHSKYDFDSLTQQDCIELIEEKIKKDKEKILVNWESDQITIEKGRWGKIYVIQGKKRVPLSKNIDPLKISINDAKDILKIKK